MEQKDKIIAQEFLKKLQRKIINGDVNNNIFFSNIKDTSSKLLDLVELSQKYSTGFLKDLFTSRKVVLMPPNQNADKNQIKMFNEILSKAVKLYNEAKQIEKEIGEHSLAIGFPYISGNIGTSMEGLENNADIYRAPLLLWKVSLKFPSMGIIELEIIDEPTLNPLVATRMAMANKRLIDNKYEINTSQPNWFDELDKAINAIGFIFSDENKAALKRIFTDFNPQLFDTSITSRKDFAKQLGTKYTKLDTFCTMGIFVNENASISRSYNSMLQSDEALEFVNYIDNRTRINFDLDEKQIEFKENDVLQISDLDYSQKNAIFKSLSDSFVIQGPPGTGKSQTIVNIIANLLNNKKSILFIVEKKIAGEVVYKRLLDLNIFSLMLFDIDDPITKTDFYNKITDSLNEMYQQKTIVANDSRQASIEIDQIFDKINEYKTFQNSLPAVEYLNFIKKHGLQFNDLEAVYLKYEIILNDAKNKDDFFANCDRFYKLIEYNKQIESILDKYNVKHENLIIFVNFINTIKARVPNVEEHLAYYLEKHEIKDKYGLFARGTIKRGMKNEIYYSMLSALNNISENEFETILQFDNNKYVSITELKKSEKRFKQMVDFYNEYPSYDVFDISLYLDFIKFRNFEVINRSRITDKVKQYTDRIDELLIEKQNEELALVKAKQIRNIWDKMIKEPNLQRQFQELIDKNQGKRKTNINQTFKKYNDIISLCFPIIITTPEIASTIYDINTKFDYVIVDEASQITIEDGFPMLYRGDRMVVAGDQQQLQPSNYFTSKLNENFEDLYNSENINQELVSRMEAVEDNTSLLSYISKHIPDVMLKYHYRSTKRELIEFSNVVFYDGELITTDSTTNTRPAIELINVDGEWKNNVNEKEANVIVDKVKEICEQENHGSIGIITFNIKQRDLIIDKLKNCHSAPVLAELNRINSKGEDISLFVKNIDNVQGDERDNIIFSITYARSSDGKFVANFGPLCQNGGKNRINVAASRAKDRMYVVKSIPASLIPRDKAQGSKVLGEFLEYIELFDASKTLNNDEITTFFNRFLTKKQSKEEAQDTPFSDSVYNDLSAYFANNIRYKLVRNVGKTSYKIDIAIFDNTINSYVLGIQCDDYRILPNLTQKEQNYYKHKYLKARGWNLFRIPIRDWYRTNRQTIIDNIAKAINYEQQ